MTEPRFLYVDGRQVAAGSCLIARGDVLAAAGLADAPANLVVRVDEGFARLVQPGAAIVLDAGGRSSFRTFRDGRLHHLKLDGRVWEWGAPSIGEEDVRAVGTVSAADELFVVGSDEPLRRGSMLDLTAENVPQIRSRPGATGPVRVPVVVNGCRVEVAGPEIGFAELVRVAFPQVADLDRADRALTVTWRHGPPDRPEGSVLPRQTVRLQPGMVLGVTATVKG